MLEVNGNSERLARSYNELVRPPAPPPWAAPPAPWGAFAVPGQHSWSMEQDTAGSQPAQSMCMVTHSLLDEPDTQGPRGRRRRRSALSCRLRSSGRPWFAGGAAAGAGEGGQLLRPGPHRRRVRVLRPQLQHRGHGRSPAGGGSAGAGRGRALGARCQGAPAVGGDGAAVSSARHCCCRMLGMCRVGGCAAPHFQPGRCVTRGAVAAVLLQAHQGAGRLGFVAGVIPAEKLPGFERLLFRATRCGLRSSPPTGPQLTPARSPCPASAPHLRPRPPLTPPPPLVPARASAGATCSCAPRPWERSRTPPAASRWRSRCSWCSTRVTAPRPRS